MELLSDWTFWVLAMLTIYLGILHFRYNKKVNKHGKFWLEYLFLSKYFKEKFDLDIRKNMEKYFKINFHTLNDYEYILSSINKAIKESEKGSNMAENLKLMQEIRTFQDQIEKKKLEIESLKQQALEKLGKKNDLETSSS